MRKTKLSRLCWTLVLIFCGSGAGGVSLCSRIAMDLGEPEVKTLCDLDYCTCHNPFGRVRCVCPDESPDEELIIRSKGSCSVPYGTTSLFVDNCKKVTVIPEAFDESSLVQTLQILNVKEVRIEGPIFPSGGPPRTIIFTNSTIPDIPSFTFTGNIHSVLFENCYVGVVRAFAFSSIHSAYGIAFRGSNVANVEAQSLKKFTMNKFIIFDTQFNVIPSRFVVDVTVETLFKIDSSFFDEVRTLGFKIYSPKKVILTNSMINRLHGEALKVESRGEVVIDSNVFNGIDNEAFRGLTTDRATLFQAGKQRLKFENQTVSNLHDKSLYFNRTNFDVLVTRLMIDEVCTCDGLVLWGEMITIGKKPKDPIESELEPIWCRLDDKKEGNFDYISGREFYNEHCTKLTTSIYFFVIIISATAVCLVIIIPIIVCVLRRKKKWQPVPLTSRSATRNPQRKPKKEEKDRKNGEVVKPETTKAMIVPDGRTYKETEFHIIVEKAEPLDEECVPYTVVRDRSRSQVN